MRAVFLPKCWMLIFILLISCNYARASKVVELSVQGSIGPASADYLVRGIEYGQGSDLILIQMNTPGGLDKSMRQIVQSILTSKVPIVVYVAPSGARAASAGSYILYAATLAAMAPGTHLGAATPVNLMDENDKENPQKNTMDNKMTHDAVAYMRTLAQLRKRDVAFAEKAVLDAATMTAPEALKLGVINVLAQDRSDLLTQLNGMLVTQNGRQIKLITTSPKVTIVEPDWRMRFLLVITDPTIAYLLLLLGIYGIFFELVNPGFMAPGVIGAVAILIALYALQLLPINYAGLTLILAGIAFIVSEAFTPNFGVLGLGGTLAFVVGSIFLIDTKQESYQIAWSAIGMMAAINALILMMVIRMAMKSRKMPIQHGLKLLIGAEGRSLGTIALQGQAFIRGEIWSVYARQVIRSDTAIRVVAAEGLKLEVEAIEGDTK